MLDISASAVNGGAWSPRECVVPWGEVLGGNDEGGWDLQAKAREGENREHGEGL